ncbi:Kinesin-like protein, partial [Drosera capensis]
MAPQMTPLKRTQSMKTSTPSKTSHLGSVSRVRVVVRVRSFPARQIASEKGGQPVSCVSVLDSEAKPGNEVVVCMRDQESRRSDCYMLDGFFGHEETNIPEIFEKEVMPLIHGIFRGYNGTNPGEYLECRHTVSIAARSRHVTNFVASEQKHGVVNMETKLHAWLESKGRTKSVQRIEAIIRSPPFSRTPSSLRKQDPSLSSKKENTVFRNVTMENDRSPTTSQRMLSLELAPSDVNIEEGYSCDVIEYASPLRMALCPLNSNITSTPNKELSSCCQVSTETPFVSTRDKYQDFGTPLDKFTARSSALKNFLADEYIDFLNAASREELMELKGIGAKRAKYIIDNRETSPLKSLSDLEKVVGLSSKQ